MKRGNVVKCDFGHGVGSEVQGIRPCVIVSNNRNNRFAPIVTVVPLTTKEGKANLPVHVPVSVLGLPSIAMCEQVKTVSKLRISVTLDKLDAEMLKAIDRALCIQLKLLEKEE